MIEFLINQFDWSFDQPDWLIYWSACCPNDLLINQSDWLNDYPIDLLSWTYWYIYIYILIYWSDCLTDTLITLYVCFLLALSRCLRFSYSMYGADMGSLNVYFQSGTGSRTQVWSRSGDQGNQWNIAEVDIPSVSNVRVNNK